MGLFCPICSKPMREFRRSKELKCYFCGEAGTGDVACEEQHFVCESCRLASHKEAIERIGLASTERDPIRIADKMMKHPAIPTYGAEHHPIAAVAMFVAVKNLKGEKAQAKEIKRLIKLTEKIPYGSCGFLGVCGAAAGVGATLSALLDASYMKDKERTLAMEAASQANLAIAREGGPRCCVASVYIALYEASKMAREVLGIEDLKPDLPLRRCGFMDKAEDCRRERCRFFKGARV